jgi:hypothetical protein
VYADDMIFLRRGALVAAGDLQSTLTAPILREVFDADAKVSEDDFTGGLRLSFKSLQKTHKADGSAPEASAVESQAPEAAGGGGQAPKAAEGSGQAPDSGGGKDAARTDGG